jgi:hypothetical protein
MTTERKIREPRDITDPVLVIRIQRGYRPEMTAQALYEITRGAWVVGPRRAEARYALAVFNGVVREVYAIDAWHPAGSTAYTTRPYEHVNRAERWEFTGELASDEMRQRYVGTSVAHLWRRGASNPLTYVNC